MRIAIYQCEGKPVPTKDTLAMLCRSALEAAGQGAQLLICSEMFLTGYNIGDMVFELAETADEARSGLPDKIDNISGNG